MPERMLVYGADQSFFTRKLEGALAYKGVLCERRRSVGALPEARAAGWPGGIPVVRMPGGAWAWDTTELLHHLELRFPEPALLPPDPVPRFLDAALEDFADEWLYRPAVGSRWHFPENHAVGGFELARAATHELPVGADEAYRIVREHVTATTAPFGVTGDNVQAWIDEALRPWQRAAGALLARRPCLFGERPALADFGFFGGCAAHFANDPLCRRWLDADAPALVKHTQRLMEPSAQRFGDWAKPDVAPDELVALLAELGRHYLPWVSRAARDGAAPLPLAGREVAATPFLANARRVLLARYVALRCDALDAVLDRAGILRFYADFTADAGAIPDPRALPQPRLNRPYPPPWERERSG
jgi:glutathione S-transferase